MRGAASGRDALLQPAAVGQQPDAIAGGQRHLRQRQRRRHRRVEHRLRADARARSNRPASTSSQTVWLRSG